MEVTPQKGEQEPQPDSRKNGSSVAGKSDIERLHALSMQLLEQDDVEDALCEVMNASAELLHADRASVQIYDEVADVLRLVGTKEFDQRFADRFATIDSNFFTTCAAVLKRRGRVLVEDLESSSEFATFYEAVGSYGPRAVLSTPLFGSEEQLLGVFSMYWHQPHRPSETEHRLLDLYTQQAARQIERRRAQNEREWLFRQAEADRERLAEVFQQAPSFMCILRGPDHVFERANELYYQLVGCRDIIGKPVREALPEVKGQGFIELLDRVYETGEPYVGTDTQVMLQREAGKTPEERYVNFVYQPVRDPDGSISGIFAQGVDLTERKKAEMALARVTAMSERQRRLYEAIISSTPDLVYVFDLDYRFTFVNDALLKMWGRTLEDSVGKTLLEVGYEPWHAEMHEREIDQVVATKQPIRGEVPFTHATLGRRIYDYIFVPVLNGEGEVEAIAGTTRDVTERKQMEEALRHSEHRFRSLVEQAPIAIQMFDPDGTCVSANAAWADFWQSNRADLEGYNILQDTQIEAKGIMPDIRRAFAGETVAIPPVKYDPAEIGKVGRPRWLDATAYPVRDDEGKPHEVIFMLRDITQRKRAEEALRESEEKYRHLVSLLPAAVYTCDAPTGKITFYNDHAARLWGRAPATGDTDQRFCGSFKLWWPDGESLPHHETPMAVAIREGRSFRNEEVVIERPDGSRVTVLVNIDPIRDRHGRVVGAINVFHDTTALKQAQEALKDLNETLEDRVRKRTEQVYKLASMLTMAEQEERRRISQILHDDLQQLLYGIQLKMSFVKDAAGGSKEEGLLRHVGEAIDRLDDAIATTRQLTVDLSPPVLQGEGLTDTLQWLQSQMRDLHSLEVEIEASHPFRIPSEDMRVLLFQIVRELLFNVVKHAETDRARVELFEEEGHLVIRVMDNGRGFDVSGARAEQVRDGGFGLFSVRERLGLFGGHMEIESQPNEGTCITVHTTVTPAT